MDAGWGVTCSAVLLQVLGLGRRTRQFQRRDVHGSEVGDEDFVGLFGAVHAVLPADIAEIPTLEQFPYGRAVVVRDDHPRTLLRRSAPVHVFGEALVIKVLVSGTLIAVQLADFQAVRGIGVNSIEAEATTLAIEQLIPVVTVANLNVGEIDRQQAIDSVLVKPINQSPYHPRGSHH